MEIIIGTYEEFLVGFRLMKKKKSVKQEDNINNDDDSCKYVLEQSFTNHCHNGSIRCLTNSNKYLVSGSIDERINIINIRYRNETGTLILHSGTIKTLKFFKQSYLFSGSDDGLITIWSIKQNWRIEKILRGHKSSIEDLAIHPSGKLLLSISKDQTLRTWNLIKGRCSYIVNIKQIAHQLQWSTTAIYFSIVFDNFIDIYDITNGSIRFHIEKKQLVVDGNKRLNKICFITDHQIIITLDSPDLIIFDLSMNKIINRIDNAHNNRIKDLYIIDWNNVDGDDSIDDITIDKIDRQSNHRWLVTCSSDGFIKIWSFNFDDLTEKPSLIAKVDSTCRPTCLTVWNSFELLNSNNKNEFIVPELKITKEELELCRAKATKKLKTTNADADADANADDDENLNNDNDGDGVDNDDHNNDDDDEKLIKEMKKRSKNKLIIKNKNSIKTKRNNNKKMTTFKMKQKFKLSLKNKK